MIRALYRSRPAALTAALLLASIGPTHAAAQSPGPDPVACHPGFADFVRQHPSDWYQLLDPAVKPIADVQRMIGLHGLVVGFSDERGNPGYTPNVVVVVAFHDGTNLYAAGLPRVWPNGKPVVVRFAPGIPQAGIGPVGPGAPPPQPAAPALLPPGCPAAWAAVGAGSGQVAPATQPATAGQAPSTGQALLPTVLPRTGGVVALGAMLAGAALLTIGALLRRLRPNERP